MLPCFGAFFYVAARCFSPCLIFWCFWIKPKAQKKKSKRIFFRSILRETILPLRLGVSCKERIYHLLSPKGGAKSVRRAKKSGNGRRLAPKTLRGRARARVFDGAASARSSSRFFAMRSLLCAARNHDLFRYNSSILIQQAGGLPDRTAKRTGWSTIVPHPSSYRRESLISASTGTRNDPNRGARAYSRRPSPQLSDRCGRRVRGPTRSPCRQQPTGHRPRR